MRAREGGRAHSYGWDGMGWMDRSATPYSKAVLPGFYVHLQPVGDLAEQARDHPDRLHGRERDLYIESPGRDVAAARSGQVVASLSRPAEHTGVTVAERYRSER